MRNVHSFPFAVFVACTAVAAQPARTTAEPDSAAAAARALPVASTTVRQELVSHPKLPLAAPQRPSTAVAAVAPAPAVEWKMDPSDGFMSRTLRRWARDAKATVLWQAPKDLPAIPASYRGDFFDAVRGLMRDSEKFEYPLHACAHDNVVRILHDTQSCTR